MTDRRAPSPNPWVDPGIIDEQFGLCNPVHHRLGAAMRDVEGLLVVGVLFALIVWS